MVNSSGTSTEHSALTSVLPQWPSADPSQETRWETYELGIPAEVYRTLSGTGRQDAALAAAYAKVASVLTGERSVSVGYRSADCDDPRLLRMIVPTGSWLDLIGQADQALGECTGTPSGVGHSGHLASDLETVLDVTGSTGDQRTESDHGNPGLLWSFSVAADSSLLRLNYRTDCYSEECIARYAGYYLHALDLLLRDPLAKHGDHSLVAPGELDARLHEFAGPMVALPSKPFHRLFSERAIGVGSRAIGDRTTGKRSSCTPRSNPM